MIEYVKGIPLIGHAINGIKSAVGAVSSRAGCELEIRREQVPPQASLNRYEVVVINHRNKKRQIKVILESMSPLGENPTKQSIGEDKNREPLKFPVELGVKDKSQSVLLPKSETAYSFLKVSDWHSTASIRVEGLKPERQPIYPVVLARHEDGYNAATFQPIKCVFCVEFINGKDNPIEKRFTFEITPKKYYKAWVKEEDSRYPMIELNVKRL